MSKQTIQVVAFRRDSLTDNIDRTKPFYLDITNAPEIRVNYNFEDVKDPSKRKTDFSQKFKLPMTDKNNQFFQHWYNVNIDKLIYSQTAEIESQVIVNGNVILTGNLKLMGFYKKGGYYDCVILGKISTLFSQIGNKTVRESFYIQDAINENSFTLDTELMHTWTKEIIPKSWDGTETTFLNTSGVSLRDSVANVQKVLYPITSRIQNFALYDPVNSLNWLANNVSVLDFAAPTRFDLSKLPPALQLREVLSNIFRKAGFYWESTFLDSVYFRRIFVTLMDYKTDTGIPLPVEQLNQVYAGSAFKIAPLSGTIGSCIPYATSLWYNYQFSSRYDGCNLSSDGSSVTGPATIDPNPPYILADWNTWASSTIQYGFTPPTTAEYQMTFRAYFDTTNTATIEFHLQWHVLDWGMNISEMTNGTVTLNNQTGEYIEITLTTNLSENYTYTPSLAITSLSGDSDITMTFGQTTLINGAYYEITVLPAVLGNQAYLSTVAPGLGFDPDLKQSDLLKDVIERFNLVLANDKDDPSKIIIEPFKDYIGSGELKKWDNKIDADKEQYLKPTNDLLKSEVLYQDKPSKDFYNKLIDENKPEDSVYGKYHRIYTNPFAKKGVFKNSPVFAPFIVDRVNTTFGSGEYDQNMHNFVVHHNVSYNDEGASKIEKQPHKLFYYNGTPTQLDATYYMYTFEFYGSNVWNAFSIEYDKYPLCSTYELGPDGLPTVNTNQVRSLTWGYNRSAWIQQSSLWNGYVGNIQNTLYNLYYKEYIAELYNENSRLLELNLYLTPTDIAQFSWKDTVYLNQTFWRILKIHNYQAGTESSTKVTLIKVPNLEGQTCFSDACGDVLYTTISNDIYDGNIYSFDDGAGGFTQNTTLPCCNCLGGYFIPFGGTVGWCLDPTPTGSGDGVGPINNTGSTGFEMMPTAGGGLPGIPMTGSGSKSLTLNTLGEDINSSKTLTKFYPFKSSQKDFKGFSIDKNGVVTSLGAPTEPANKYPNINTQTSTYSLANVGGNDTIYLSLSGDRKGIRLKGGTISDVELKLTMTVIDGSIDNGGVRTLVINSGFKVLSGSITQLGNSGGIVNTAIYDTISTLNITPSMYYRVIGSGVPQLEIRLRCTGGDSYTKINYVGELKIKSVGVMNTLGGLNSVDAIYENGDEIAFEDNTHLRYN